MMKDEGKLPEMDNNEVPKMSERQWFKTGFGEQVTSDVVYTEDAQYIELRCQQMLDSGRLDPDIAKVVSGIKRYARRHGRVTHKQATAIENICRRMVRDYAESLGYENRRPVSWRDLVDEFDPGDQELADHAWDGLDFP